MIHHLSGTLASKQPTEAVIDTGGVGFRVLIPTSTFERLPAKGAAASVLTYLHVREDALQLFGFATAAERAVFGAMISVSGVGPKLALAALSAMRPAEIRRHIVSGEAGFLTRIPGVGKKTAERLVLDLRDRLDSIDVGEDGKPLAANAHSDAVSALEALGFSRNAAEKAIRTAARDGDGDMTVESLIRIALRDA